jgi:AcrR family transcriptional regulator
MGRPEGSRNADYDTKRVELLDALAGILQDPKHTETSMRQLAQAVGVTGPTLRHYFGDRDALIRAVFQHWFERSQGHRDDAAAPIEGDVRASLLGLLETIRRGWTQFGVGSLQAAALAMGLKEPSLGPSYVSWVLEPTLAVVETRLRRHVDAGDLAPLDPRQAGLMLLAPVFLALLHQHELGGDRCRPLDLERFGEATVDAFLRAFPPLRHA